MQEKNDRACAFFYVRYHGVMAGKKGRSGRRSIGGGKRAYQVRLVEAQAEAFDARVRELNEQASTRGTRASATSVLQMLVARWLEEEAAR